MKVLFFHANTPDYLGAGLFHGLRSLLGENCVDLPRFDCMYHPLPEAMRQKIRGHGFTLYGLLPDITELATERFFIWEKNIRDFDLYVIADIWRQWPEYQRLRRIVPLHKIAIIDPGDTTRVFPFDSYKALLTHQKAKLFNGIKNVRYYKREFSKNIQARTGFAGPINVILRLFMPNDIRPIHFAIPAGKIHYTTLEQKEKLFASNIVDEEFSKQIANSHFIPLGEERYSFDKEEAYYADIRKSKFGITSKRRGWDCMRHYEFAANGAVLCFKNLQHKDPLNAPHGLNDSNCVIYTNSNDLLQKINAIGDYEYNLLLANSYRWVQQQTTLELATTILNDSK